MSDPQAAHARFKLANLAGVLAYLAQYPYQTAVCLGFLLINLAIEMILPQLLGNGITGLRQAGEYHTAFSLAPLVIWFMALVVVRAGAGFILGIARNRLVQQVISDVRAAIYNALQRLAFHYHDRSNTGELISRSTTDVSRLQDFLYACLFLSVDIAVAISATVILICAISPLLGLLTVATMAPTIGLIAFYANQLQPQWRHVHDLHGAMTTVIQENIAGVRVVKAFAKEQAEIAKFTDKKELFLGTLTKTVNFWAARVPFAQFIFGLSMPLALWLGGRQVIQGQLLIGDLAKVVFYLMAVGHRMGMIGQFTNILQNASASAERIMEIIREPQQIQSGRRDLPVGHGAVQFDQVYFNYHNGKASLLDVTFEVKAGQTMAIVGPTGSGKTTLVNLIPRFYDPTRGRVLVDGVEVRELKLAALRRSVSVIFQETFLFSASVAENIAYGKPEATREAIIACARAAQAHDFIEQLESGYETIIGERGISLSGGQRQRIAIARAFLMDPRILILDDAMASVDAQTEHLIQTAIRQLCAGRTTLIIAHRLSTVQHADHVLVLKAGRIVESGTHEQLMRQGTFYREFFERQLASK